MDEELKLKNLQLYQQALLDNQSNSNELIIVPLYKEDGTMGFKLMPNKKEAMELGANDPLFLALTAGTSAGKEALKGVYNLGVKGFTKLQPYLNIMSPGTKEFMTMLNSGIPGKIASGAVTAAEGYWINEAIKQAKENPNIGNIAMAGLSTVPYANGVIGTVANAAANGYMNLAKSYKPVRDLTMKATVAWDNLLDNISQISLNIKKAGVKFDKWWNADERIRHLLEKSKDLSEFYSKQLKMADTEKYDIGRTLSKSKALTRQLKDKYKKLEKYEVLPSDISISTDVNPVMDFPLRKTFYINRENRSARGSGEEIDLSKLSEENLIKLLVSKKLRRDFNPEFRISLDSHVGKTEMDWFLKLFKLGKNENGDYILISNNDFSVVGKHPYTPEQFVDTQYSLGSFSDPSKPLLNGEIKFGGGREGTIHIENPSINLNTRDLNKEYIIQDPNILPNKLIYLDPEYRKLFAENMAYVEQKIPGFVPYGSSVGLVDVGLPHSAGDIDGYMKASDWEAFLKKNPGLKFEDKGDLKSIVFNEQMGKNGIVDINLVHSDKDGYVSGERGVLLARMFFPEIYSEWNLFGRKGPLKVKVDDVMKAASELRAAKTVADAFEINPTDYRKEKHLGRPFVYLSSGNPEQVAKGLELYGKSFGFTSGFPVTLDELTDIERNKKILRDLKMPVSIEEVASDPQKMKNTLTYWYMTNTIRGRGTDREAPQIIKNSLTQQWNPNTNRGGVFNGIGRNSVVFGDSRRRPIYGFILLSPNTPLTGSVEDKIKLVKRFTGMWDYEFTPEEITQMQNIGKRFGLNFSEGQLRNSERILDSTPKSESGALFFNDLSKEMGINALTRSTDHGSSLYSSILEDSSNKPLIIYDINAPESNPINLFNLFKRIEKLLGVTPEALENIYRKLDQMTSGIKEKRIGPGKHERYIELDTPLDINIPRKRIIKTRIKSSGQFEKYLKHLKDAENAYNSALSELNKLNEALENASEKRHRMWSLYTSAPVKNWGLWHKYGHLSDKINQRKNIATYTPLAVVGSTAAGYGLKTLIDNRNETMDELYKKGLKHNTTDLLILKYKAESAAALEGRIVSKRLAKLIKQELESRGVTNLE